MEKTIKEWLESLPEPYKTQALLNLEQTEKDEAEEDGVRISTAPSKILVSRLSDAISQAFIWSATAEGMEYWGNLVKAVKVNFK